MNNHSKKDPKAQTALLLRDLCSGAETGLNATALLEGKAQSEDMRAQLRAQRAKYQSLLDRAKQLLAERDVPEDHPGALTRAGMWAGLESSTLMDKSDAHLATLLMEGSAMSLSELSRSVQNAPEADAQTRALAEDFLQAERGHIDQDKRRLES